MIVDSLVEVGGTEVEENLVALHMKNGRIKYTENTDQAAYSSPIVVPMFGERQVIHFSANEVVGISHDVGLMI